MKTPLPVVASIAQRRGYGGHAWAFLHYVLGFRELGYEPILIDRLSAEMTADASGGPSQSARREAIEWFEAVVDSAGLRGSASLLLDNGEAVGLSRADLIRRTAQAPCLIDVMGFLEDPELLAASPMSVFLDVDPGFPQIWRELGQANVFGGHDRHVTVGRNIGRADCAIPACGLEWVGTLPPVVLDRWRVVPTASRAFRSIGAWRGPYGPLEYRSQTLGLRVHEFRRFVGLPELVDAEFAVALDIDSADEVDAELLTSHGWQLEEPRLLAGSLSAYQGFIEASGAEIAIAKNLYVATNSGWFSDRSACFLASGRPVLAQDTGFAELLPTGEGLVAFSTPEEAVEGANRILSDWERHSRAARGLAEELFDSTKVLGGLLDELGVA